MKNIERYKNSDDFVKIMEAFIKRYKEDVKENSNKEYPIKNWEDEKFKIWHIILDAYDEGFKQADDYWVNSLFELTEAEEHFREKISNEIG